MELAEYLLKCMKEGIKIDFHEVENQCFIMWLTTEVKNVIIPIEHIFNRNLALAPHPELIIGRELRRCYLSLKDKAANA